MRICFNKKLHQVFWGCEKYPTCKGSLPANTPSLNAVNKEFIVLKAKIEAYQEALNKRMVPEEA